MRGKKIQKGEASSLHELIIRDQRNMTCTAVLFQMGKAYFKGKLDSGRSSCTITSHFGPMFYNFITAKF